jgi:hypothetical protein
MEADTLDEGKDVSRYTQKIRYLHGWLFVRPRRWFFWKMCWVHRPILLPRKDECFGWLWPNVHWWVLDRTIFRLCKWMYWDAWRPFCRWENGWLSHKPWYAKVIQRIGATTAGFAISGGECFHCASPEGDQVDLSDDETGTTFKLERTWTCQTQDGTDHRFSGTTICPKCGYEAYYEDGSL